MINDEKKQEQENLIDQTRNIYSIPDLCDEPIRSSLSSSYYLSRSRSDTSLILNTDIHQDETKQSQSMLTKTDCTQS